MKIKDLIEILERFDPEMECYVSVTPDYDVSYDTLDKSDVTVGSEITGPYFVWGDGDKWYTEGCPNEVIEEACEESDHTPDEYSIGDVLIVSAVR